MNVLKLTLVATSIFALSLGSFAQGKRMEKADQPKKDKIEALKEKLNLDDAQVVKLKEVHTNFEEKNKVLEAKMDPLQKQLKALKAEKKTNKENMDAEIEKVLTPQQLTKYKEMKAAHQEKKAAKKAEMKQGMKPQNH
jgi:hypothetical protein